MEGINHGAAMRIAWRSRYWLMALAAPLALYVLEIMRILGGSERVTPQIGWGARLIMMGVFFFILVPIPRLLAAIIARLVKNGIGAATAATTLTAFGLALSVLHLSLLALIHRLIYSPPGWGIAALAGSTLEAWIRYGVFWVILYALYVAVLWPGAAAGQARRQLSASAWRARSNGLPRKSAADRLLVRRGPHSFCLSLDEIGWIEASGNYACLHTQRGEFLLRKPLVEVEREFADRLVRVHRSILVNLEQVVGLEASGSAARLQMRDGHRVPLSRRRRKRVAALLGN